MCPPPHCLWRSVKSAHVRSVSSGPQDSACRMIREQRTSLGETHRQRRGCSDAVCFFVHSGSLPSPKIRENPQHRARGSPGAARVKWTAASCGTRTPGDGPASRAAHAPKGSTRDGGTASTSDSSPRLAGGGGSLGACAPGTGRCEKRCGHSGQVILCCGAALGVDFSQHPWPLPTRCRYLRLPE